MEQSCTFFVIRQLQRGILFVSQEPMGKTFTLVYGCRPQGKKNKTKQLFSQLLFLKI